jgi:hypothetical protein
MSFAQTLRDSLSQPDFVESSSHWKNAITFVETLQQDTGICFGLRRLPEGFQVCAWNRGLPLSVGEPPEDAYKELFLVKKCERYSGNFVSCGFSYNPTEFSKFLVQWYQTHVPLRDFSGLHDLRVVAQKEVRTPECLHLVLSPEIFQKMAELPLKVPVPVRKVTNGGHMGMTLLTEDLHGKKIKIGLLDFVFCYGVNPQGLNEGLTVTRVSSDPREKKMDFLPSPMAKDASHV